MGVKKLLTTIPVRNPNRQEFVRVHPDPTYRGDFAIIELDGESEVYVVSAPLQSELADELTPVTLYTTTTPQGVLFLWPVRLPSSDGRVSEWHRSRREAAEKAMTIWIRVKANMRLGAYDIFEAQGRIPDPDWPELSFDEIVRIAFRDRVIDSPDHPVIKCLRGAA